MTTFIISVAESSSSAAPLLPPDRYPVNPTGAPDPSGAGHCRGGGCRGVQSAAELPLPDELHSAAQVYWVGPRSDR